MDLELFWAPLSQVICNALEGELLTSAIGLAVMKRIDISRKVRDWAEEAKSLVIAPSGMEAWALKVGKASATDFRAQLEVKNLELAPMEDLFLLALSNLDAPAQVPYRQICSAGGRFLVPVGGGSEFAEENFFREGFISVSWHGWQMTPTMDLFWKQDPREGDYILVRRKADKKKGDGNI